MRNVTEIQQRLIALGYPVGSAGADGKFGLDSLAAYNHWRAAHGAGPVNNASMAQLNQDLFPEEQPGAKPRLTPNPVVQAIGAFALRTFLNQALKGFPMGTILLGAGTYVTGGIMIVVGVGSLVAAITPLGAIPGFTPLDPTAAWTSITNGFGFLFLRRAIANK